MDRKNTWILGGAIVLGFLVFGLSQLWAQRFPGDGRGSEGMVGRYQVVRSSPETILLLDTVTGELYSAGREDVRPASARRRGGEMGGEEFRFKEKSDARNILNEKGPARFPGPKDAAKDVFKDKADFPFDPKDKKE